MNKSKRKIKVTKEREVNTYAELWHTSHCLLEKGIHEPRGSFHQIMASPAILIMKIKWDKSCKNTIEIEMISLK